MSKRAEWMSGKYGLMIHYLPPELEGRDGFRSNDVDEITARFDVETFLRQFLETGAEWLIMTLGQNTGFYNAPNEVIDRRAGPGHCARRDLVREIAVSLRENDKRLILYLPCEIHKNRSMIEPFGWCEEPGTPQLKFQKRWLEVIRFWAEAYGPLVSGWWFDGCYPWEKFHSRYMQWDQWHAAARSGNPEAAITFNDGCFCEKRLTPIHQGFDYFAGEASVLYHGLPRLGHDLKGFAPTGKNMPADSPLWHVLFPVDALWWHGTPLESCGLHELPENPLHGGPMPPGTMEPPAYRDADLLKLLDAFCGQGGAVTFNAGVFMEGEMGTDTLNQLRRIGRAYRSARRERRF